MKQESEKIPKPGIRYTPKYQFGRVDKIVPGKMDTSRNVCILDVRLLAYTPSAGVDLLKELKKRHLF